MRAERGEFTLTSDPEAVHLSAVHAFLTRAYWSEGIDCILKHPDLQTLRRFGLVTRDAHELYRQVGFSPLAAPDRHMEIVRPGLYKPQPSGPGKEPM